MKHHVQRILTRILAGILLISTCALGACDTGESIETANETASASATESATESVTEAPTESQTETESVATVYYVCNDASDPEGTAAFTFDNLPNATRACDRLKHMGYRVVTNTGENAYLPYTELQCDILRECKYVTDFVRDNRYHYGDAALNPALGMPTAVTARKVSCDRFVAWALYNVGFTNQPRTQGVVVSAMAAWCERNGFEVVEKEEDLQPGDVVLVKWTGSYPAHTFIYAGKASNGQSYRYDCGSDTRIQSTQPSVEPIVQFWRGYRAVADSPYREVETE